MAGETEYVPIPDWVDDVTGNPQINQAFRIATTLVDDMRRKYHARGGLPGWLPISDGIRARMVKWKEAFRIERRLGSPCAV